MEYTIKNKYLTVRIATAGAELQSIKDQEGTEYLWQGDENTWPDRAPNLFPYIARLTKGSYTYEGKTYRMPPHGFLPSSMLEAVERDRDRVVLELSDNESTCRQYPFMFLYRISYALVEKKIQITYTVKNNGKEKMYFGIGGHPGFQVPLEDGLAFEDYSLVFSETASPFRVGMSADCFADGQDRPFPLTQGRRLALSHDMFDDDAIILRDMAKKVTLMAPGGRKSVTVSFPRMNYLGIWHWPRTEVPYVCIEPWSSLPSRKGIVEDLKTQENLISLPAGETYVNQWEIEIGDGMERGGMSCTM